jgi:hypothetical protein
VSRHTPGPLDWPLVAFDSWMLAGEAAWVISLRCARMAAGGSEANREAVTMVTEKLQAQAELATALTTGRFGSEPSQVASRTIAHYSKRVRANRKRLTR